MSGISFRELIPTPIPARYSLRAYRTWFQSVHGNDGKRIGLHLIGVGPTRWLNCQPTIRNAKSRGFTYIVSFIEISRVFRLQGTDSRLPYYLFTEFPNKNFQLFALTPVRKYSDLGVGVEQRTFRLPPRDYCGIQFYYGGIIVRRSQMAPQLISDPRSSSTKAGILLHTELFMYSGKDDGSNHDSRRLLLVEISDRHNGRVGRAKVVLKAFDTLKRALPVEGASPSNVHHENPPQSQGNENG
jgi:hypothetical protein